ncbi:hypothetical protein EV122DRAFT_177620, partial [Schizophyllum commune]
EIDAIIEAIRATPPKHEVTIVTKSNILLKSMTDNLLKLEDRNWIDSPQGLQMKELAGLLRERSGRTLLQKYNVTQHAAEMKKATDLARQASLRRPERRMCGATSPRVNLPGARLMALSQADLYKNIRRIKTAEKPYRRKKTTENLDVARWSAFERTGKFPRDRDIWLAMRNKAISREVSQFLFKACHGAYKIGDYWEKIPNFEQRGTCPVCQTTESMEHILFGCDAKGQEVVWRLAKELWDRKHPDWPTLNLGTVLSCGIADFKADDRKHRRKGANRLYTILISESAFLIWKLRNERVIRGEERAGNPNFFSEQHIRSRWLQTMNNRLTLDREMTKSYKYGKRAIQKEVVLTTWCGVLHEELSLPEDWLNEPRVLVGVGPRRRDWRN